MVYNTPTFVIAINGSQGYILKETVLICPPPPLPPSYENLSEQPTGDSRLVSFTVNDGLFDSAPALACVNVEAVNDPPVLTLGPDGVVDVMLNYTEDQLEPLILAPDLLITGQLKQLLLN